jgi:hypothetical protein
MPNFEQHVRANIAPRERLDRFLDPEKSSWAQFDPEVGYILSNYLPRDGIDDSSTISTVQKNGARSAATYADRPRRINTYGNSFTQCHQVSDQETWQEYLAAHLGESIGNFGMGGFGVYQAYRRLRRTETTSEGAEYLLLYIWGDDHFRSLLRCRHVLTNRSWKPPDQGMFHGNFWANLEMDLQTGRFVERDSLLQTPESVYKMTDPDFMYEALKDDLMLQLSLFCRGYIQEIDSGPLSALAEILEVNPSAPDDPAQLKAWIETLRNAYAFAATRYIIEQALSFAQSNNKKLMTVLYCPQVTRQLISSGQRYDQPIADYLRDNQILHFDMNLVHLEDFKCFNLSLEDYMKRYHIGHYSPAGNHFFAHSIKYPIIEWLNPKPITYRDDENTTIDFCGYLPQ